VIDIVILVAAFAGGTWLFGWWAVPVLALAWGWRVGPTRWPAMRAAVAAGAAWCGLLLYDHVRGPAWHLARLLASVTHLPALVLLGVTVGFAFVLAWSAATVGAATAPAPRDQRP
jgi:hypothetical protein